MVSSVCFFFGHDTHIDSSLTREQTWALAVRAQVLTAGPLRGSLKLNALCMCMILVLL